MAEKYRFSSMLWEFFEEAWRCQKVQPSILVGILLPAHIHATVKIFSITEAFSVWGTFSFSSVLWTKKGLTSYKSHDLTWILVRTSPLSPPSASLPPPFSDYLSLCVSLFFPPSSLSLPLSLDSGKAHKSLFHRSDSSTPFRCSSRNIYDSQAQSHVVTYLFNDGSGYTVQAVLELLFCLSLLHTRATDTLHHTWST